MDSLAGRSETLIQLTVRYLPSIVGGVIFVVGLIVRSQLVMGIGLLVFGLSNLILGAIELTDWRGFADLYGQSTRIRIMSGWLAIVIGILMLLIGFFIIDA